MLHIRDFDNSELLHNSKNDPNLVCVVPETAYFTLDGQTKAWIVPSELAGNTDVVFGMIEAMQNRK